VRYVDVVSLSAQIELACTVPRRDPPPMRRFMTVAILQG
jgi:hypothetical protein